MLTICRVYCRRASMAVLKKLSPSHSMWWKLIFTLVLLLIMHNLCQIIARGSLRTPLACTKQKTIFFLKTHKCASSTIQNMLIRFGERNNLNFVLGSRGNYLGYPKPFSRRFVGAELWPATVDGRLDIFCHHTRMNWPEVTAVLHRHAFWFTIVRDPVDRFESAYDYFGLTHQWQMTLAEFVELPLAEKRTFPRGKSHIRGNQMAFDMGFDEKHVDTSEELAEMIAEIDSRFHLVMVAEHMDESLALLQRHLCWDLQDMAYVTRNARRDIYRKSLNDTQRQALREYLWIDQAIYDHFRQKLAQEIGRAGVATVVERAELIRAQRIRLQSHCLSAETNNSKLPANEREYSNQVRVFRTAHANEWLCKRINMPELVYTNLIRTMQIERNRRARSVQQLVEEVSGML